MRTVYAAASVAALTLLTAVGCGLGPAGQPLGRSQVVAFWAPGRHTSVAALQAGPRVVTSIAPFIESVEPDGRVTPRPSGPILPTARRLGLPVMPLFNSPVSERFLSTPALRARAVRAIADVVRRGGYPGLHLDFEPPHTRYAGDLVTFVAALHRALPRTAIDLDIVPQSGGAYDWQRLTPLVSAYALMSYDEHADGSPPGPVAATAWVRRQVALVLRFVPKNKLLLGLASYGYAWPKGSTHAVTLPLSALPAAASRAARYDPRSQEMTAAYTQNGTTYVAWWESLEGIRTKVRLARNLGLAGVTVWRVGYDTPRLWQAIASA